MQSFIQALVNRYALSPAEVVGAIESAFDLLLSQGYRQEAMVFLRDEIRLEVVPYNKQDGIPGQRIADLPALLSRSHCTAFLEEYLALAAVVKQTRRYKPFERRLLRGCPEQGQQRSPG